MAGLHLGSCRFSFYLLSSTHDLSPYGAFFNRAFSASSFRRAFFGGGHSAASAFLCHPESPPEQELACIGVSTIPLADVRFCATRHITGVFPWRLPELRPSPACLNEKQAVRAPPHRAVRALVVHRDIRTCRKATPSCHHTDVAAIYRNLHRPESEQHTRRNAHDSTHP